MNLTHQFSLSPYSSVLIRGRKLKVTCVIFWEKKKSSVCIGCFPEKYTVYPRSFEKQKPVFRRTWNLCCLCQRLLERRVHERVNKTETHFWKPCSTALLVVRNSTCEFVTLNFKLFFLDFSLFGVAVQLHSNFCFSHFVHEANTNKHTWNHWKYLSLWPHCKIKWLCQLRLPQNYPV